MLAPESGKGLGIVETKQSFLAFLPGHHVLVLWLFQDAESELPELGTGGDVCV